MRILEVILLLLGIVNSIVLFKEKLKGNILVKYVPLASMIILVLHLIIEKGRWQLYPLYDIAAAYFLLWVLQLSGKIDFFEIIKNTVFRRILIGIIILELSAVSILCYAFPVYKMPAPKGEYRIGTITFEAVDEKRSEKYGSSSNELRKIKLQVWYPSDTTKGYKRVPWLQDGAEVAKGVARMMGFPEFALKQTALVKSNSFEGSPISTREEKYPVVVISHGWTGFRNLHSDVAEVLASNGFIAVSIDHTYGSSAVVFNDGSTAMLNRKALPNRETTPDFLQYANTLVNTYAGDIRLALEELKKLNLGNQNSMFINKVDLNKIGLLGHSTGGGAAVTTAIKTVV